MRIFTLTLLALSAAVVGSVGCASLIALDSGDPVPEDGGSDEAATTSDSGAGAEASVAVDSGPTITCKPNTADCNGNPTDGCETKLDTPMNCGACGKICGPQTMCQAGVCCGGDKMSCNDDSDCCTNNCDNNKCGKP